ncbi:hypothetical protein CRG98_009205 [Punica granatum]|uniref:Uncharacterized protein n=1 Tax=Punica granatum TaxID=22663 RepID=A0A2I0KQ18_PUNGR|nr:hypothetical protein CRG98_009205 [Punica granatum]
MATARLDPALPCRNRPWEVDQRSSNEGRRAAVAEYTSGRSDSTGQRIRNLRWEGGLANLGPREYDGSAELQIWVQKE